jgi:uncharacterized phage protein gp47/JayE
VTFGVTSTGFVPMRLTDIQAQINAAIQAVFGPAINLDPEEPLGQIANIFAEREALIWGVAEDVYNSAYPDMASGVSLDNAVALTGLTRKQQTYSKVTGAIFLGTAGTVIAQGSRVQVLGNTTSLFSLDAALTIAAPVVEVQTITFSGTPASGSWSVGWNGQTTTTIADNNATASQVQTALRGLATAVPAAAPTGLASCTVTGSMAAGFVVTMTGTYGQQALMTVASTMLTAGSAPITGTSTRTTPGTVTTGNLTATQPGPVAAPAGSLTVIQSPIAGWSSVANPADAVQGQATETDAALKLRRVQSLRKVGSSTPQAIEAAVLALSGVTVCKVFENVTTTTDGSGRPAKSFETLVQGGDAQTIANTIWAEKPAGIQTYGNQTSTVVDSQGNSQTINWSRPTTVRIYVAVTLTTGAGFPSNGDALVNAAIVAYGAALTLGQSVIPVPGMVAAIAGIPGIVAATINIGTSPSPSSSAAISIAANQLATIATGDITVTP